ncbi:unnamed protein product [Orchesella dallaii]|uniref:Uncharacterized protein n=1 Tax=Orchesella dallaii TaxID=48710 RepID=A0ABP1PWN9_9HEXA
MSCSVFVKNVYRDLMEHWSMIYALFLVCLGCLTAVSLVYIVCCCCRKRNKASGGDEESLQGILNDGNSSNKDTTSVKSHNGILGIKAPLLKTKSLIVATRWVKEVSPCPPPEICIMDVYEGRALVKDMYRIKRRVRVNKCEMKFQRANF